MDVSVRRRLLFGGLALMTSRVPAQAEPDSLLMVNSVYPPFIYPPGHASGEGLDVEVSRELLKRCGLGLRVELLPWKRVLMMLEAGQADFTTTLSRDPSRDGYLAWSQPYRSGADYLFFTRHDDTRRLRRLADLRGLRLGTVAGFRYPPNLVGQEGLHIESSRDLGSLAKLLEAGRIDAFVATAIAGRWELHDRGLERTLQRQPLELRSDSPNFLGFSRKRLRPGLMEKINAALTSMQRDGSQAALEARYLG